VHPLFELDVDVPARGSRQRLRHLHRQLRTAIANGRLRPGLQLPSTRSLAKRLGVSRNTALALYDLLLSEGLVAARPGAGTFVADIVRPPVKEPVPAGTPDPRLPSRAHALDFAMAAPAVQPIDIDMRLGRPDASLFPYDVWRRVTSRALRILARAPADYLDPAGVPQFRQAVSTHVSLTRAVACHADDVIATAGAQQAFDLIARTMVVPGRTLVAVEDPGYPPLRAAFAAAGARLHHVPVDAEGMIVDALPPGCRIVCVTPSHQFPTGAAMSPRRRNALLDFARRRGAIIVEDDYDSEFRFGGRPLDAMQTLDQTGSVFYVGTFSKSLFPALRLGFVVVPAWARAAMLVTRKIADWHGPAFSQLALAAFIEDGHLARHLRRMRRIYGERRTALYDALSCHCGDWLEPIASEAGLHLAAALPPAMDARAVARQAGENGVALGSLNHYAAAEAACNGLVFGYGLCPADRVETGVSRLAAIARTRLR
jgi:GntR family transcriptional regulator/MocR family aminotransferase